MRIDLNKQEVRFRVTDPAQFDMKAVEEAFAGQNFKGVELRASP